MSISKEIRDSLNNGVLVSKPNWLALLDRCEKLENFIEAYNGNTSAEMDKIGNINLMEDGFKEANERNAAAPVFWLMFEQALKEKGLA